MSEWVVRKLGDLAVYVNGRAFKPADWGTHGLPIVRIANLNNAAAPFDFFSGDLADGHLIDTGDIVVSWSATLDAFIWNRGPAAVNQHSFKVIPNASTVDKEFLFFILKEGMHGLSSLVHGATMKHVTRPEFEGYEIRMPSSINEQRRIAARLKAQLVAVEDAREAAQSQANEVTALEKSFYRELENDLFSRSTRTLFGEWVVSYRNGFGKRPKAGEIGVIVLRIADVSGGFIRLDAPRHGMVSAWEAATYRLVPGDLLFVRVNGTKRIVGRCCVVSGEVPSDTIFNDHLIRAQLRNGLNPDYARLCVTLPSARAAIEEAASTSAGQLTVNQQILDAIEIPTLSIDEQIATVKGVENRLNSIVEMRQLIDARLADLERLPARLLAEAFHPSSEEAMA